MKQLWYHPKRLALVCKDGNMGEIKARQKVYNGPKYCSWVKYYNIIHGTFQCHCLSFTSSNSLIQLGHGRGELFPLYLHVDSDTTCKFFVSTKILHTFIFYLVPASIVYF